MSFVKIYHTNSNIKTLKDFFETERIVGIDFEKFLDTGDETTTKNRQKFYDALTDQQKYNYKINTESDINADTPLPCPIEFVIDSENATIQLIVNESNLKVSDDVVAFVHEQILEVVTNPEFRSFDLRRTNPRVTVWIWCKSLCDKGVFSQESVLDVSSFVNNVNISNTDSGGNFSFDLPPVISKQSKLSDGSATIWSLEQVNLTSYLYGSGENKTLNYLLKSSLNKIVESQAEVQFGDKRSIDEYKKIIRQHNFYERVISNNDIVFIKYEDQDNNQQYDFGSVTNMYKSPFSLAETNWDMIGLIDTNKSSFTTPADFSISITGRDLMKLIIEDGSFFFPRSYSSENLKSIFQNIENPEVGDDVNTNNNLTSVRKSFNRLSNSDGMINILFDPNYRNIEFVMNLLFGRLTNIEICPTDLFAFVDNKTKFQYQTEVEDKNQNKDLNQKNFEKQNE